jgi:hypothetical protein
MVVTRGGSIRSAVAFRALDFGGIDTLEHQLQIGRRHLQLFRISRRCWECEGALFQSFVKKSQAVSVPPEYLEAIAAFVAEDEEVAGKWILVTEEIADDGQQAIEASTHIGRLGGDEDASRGS